MKHRTIIQFFLYLIVFSSASPLFEFAEKSLILFFSTIFILLLNREKFSIRIEAALSFILFSFIILGLGNFHDISYGAIDGKTFGYWLVIAFSFLLSTAIDKERFLLVIEKTVALTLILGLPAWGITKVIPQIVSSFPTYTYGGFTHYTLFFTNFLTYGEISSRFVGFGSEPGLSQIFYLLALYSRLLRNGYKFDWFILLICIAIFFTKSTAGFFLLFLILLLLVPITRTLKYIVLFAPFLFSTLYDEASYHIENKLLGSNSFEYRYDRYGDFFGGDFARILFGYGNSYYSDMIASRGLGGYDTFLQFSQRYGILSFLILLSILYLSNRRLLPVFLIIGIGFISQSLWLLPAISFFYFDRTERKAPYAGKHR